MNAIVLTLEKNPNRLTKRYYLNKWDQNKDTMHGAKEKLKDNLVIQVPPPSPSDTSYLSQYMFQLAKKDAQLFAFLTHMGKR